MTHPDDDPQLSWDPDAPARREADTPPAAPNGWVQAPSQPEPPTRPSTGGAAPPEPRPVEWGRPAAPPTAAGPTAAGPTAAGPTEPPAEDAGAPEGEPPKHRSRGKEHDRVRTIVEWVAVIVGALVVALVVKTFLFQAFYIPSSSMEPTLEEGDRVLVNKLSYDLHDIHRGDIVVFELPPDKVGPDGIKDLIKRVVGLPGEVIETRQGIVYIDGERLEEPYLPEGTLTDSPPIERQRVPDDHIFVMGDNRDNSADSRYANRGPIPVDDVVGRAFVQVWPPTDLGGL